MERFKRGEKKDNHVRLENDQKTCQPTATPCVAVLHVYCTTSHVSTHAIWNQMCCRRFAQMCGLSLEPMVLASPMKKSTQCAAPAGAGRRGCKHCFCLADQNANLQGGLLRCVLAEYEIHKENIEWRIQRWDAVLCGVPSLNGSKCASWCATPHVAESGRFHAEAALLSVCAINETQAQTSTSGCGRWQHAAVFFDVFEGAGMEAASPWRLQRCGFPLHSHDVLSF